MIIFFYLDLVYLLHCTLLVEDSSNTGRYILNTMTDDLQIPESFENIIESVVIGVSDAVTHKLGIQYCLS